MWQKQMSQGSNIKAKQLQTLCDEPLYITHIFSVQWLFYLFIWTQLTIWCKSIICYHTCQASLVFAQPYLIPHCCSGHVYSLQQITLAQSVTQTTSMTAAVLVHYIPFAIDQFISYLAVYISTYNNRGKINNGIDTYCEYILDTWRLNT